MAAALPVASLLASGASSVAGAGFLPFLTGVGPQTGFLANLSLGSISTGLSVAAGAVSGLTAFGAGQAAAKGELIASRERAAELRLQAQQERTQEALDSAERERRVRRAIASQKAAFSGAGIDFTSGTAKTIQDQTAGEINRTQGQASLVSDLRISNLNRQASSEIRAGVSRAGATRSSARTGLFQSASLLSGQLSSFGKVL